VIELAARRGVEDVELIIATALHRRMTAAEIRRAVGERVYRSFYPERLKNFDAEDPHGLTHIGMTDEGEDVEISARAAESDLIVYVNINLVAMDGGHKSVAVGLAGYKSLKHHHNVHTMLHSKSYMDPREGHSAINDSVNRMGRVLKDAGVKVFQIETTVNSDTFPSNLGFLNKREWEWSASDQGLMMAAKKANDMAPPRVRREFFRRIEAPYKLTGVNAGEVEAVHERTLANLHRQQLVEVQGQAVFTAHFPDCADMLQWVNTAAAFVAGILNNDQATFRKPVETRLDGRFHKTGSQNSVLSFQQVDRDA